MDRLRDVLLRHFEARGNLDLEDLIHAYGDSRQALLLFRLFFPEFRQIEGHVVLAARVDVDGEPDQLIGKLRAAKDDPQPVLQGYRWIEVPYSFAKTSLLSDDEDHLLAELLAHSWKASLASEFPQRRWIVRVLEPETTGSVVGVGFEEAA